MNQSSPGLVDLTLANENYINQCQSKLFKKLVVKNEPSFMKQNNEIGNFLTDKDLISMYENRLKNQNTGIDEETFL